MTKCSTSLSISASDRIQMLYFHIRQFSIWNVFMESCLCFLVIRLSFAAPFSFIKLSNIGLNDAIPFSHTQLWLFILFISKLCGSIEVYWRAFNMCWFNNNNTKWHPLCTKYAITLFVWCWVDILSKFSLWIESTKMEFN